MIAWLCALALDLACGEPPNAVHPVALAGRGLDAAYRRAPAGRRAELAYGTAVVGAGVFAALTVGRLTASLPLPLRMPAALALLKSSFALRALVDAGRAVEHDLERDDSAAARAALPALVSRPVDGLDDGQVASAAIESLAENLADSYVAPLLYYAIGGLPAALAYRVVNTADAMVGYRGRYEYLGKAAARLDDVLGWLPARISAAALVLAAPLTGGDGAAAGAVLARDHGRTASPNAGWPMSAAAGALGVTLEKVGHYRLGDGRVPRARDIGAAGRLVIGGALVATAAVLAFRRR